MLEKAFWRKRLTVNSGVVGSGIWGPESLKSKIVKNVKKIKKGRKKVRNGFDEVNPRQRAFLEAFCPLERPTDRHEKPRKVLSDLPPAGRPGNGVRFTLSRTPDSY